MGWVVVDALLLAVSGVPWCLFIVNEVLVVVSACFEHPPVPRTFKAAYQQLLLVVSGRHGWLSSRHGCT